MGTIRLLVAFLFLLTILSYSQAVDDSCDVCINANPNALDSGFIVKEIDNGIYDVYLYSENTSGDQFVREPVPGVTVYIFYKASNEQQGHLERATTESDGHFIFDFTTTPSYSSLQSESSGSADITFIYCYTQPTCSLISCLRANGVPDSLITTAPGSYNPDVKPTSYYTTYLKRLSVDIEGSSLCLPLFFIVAILLGAQMIMGRNPFSYFMFSTAKPKRFATYTPRRVTIPTFNIAGVAINVAKASAKTAAKGAIVDGKFSMSKFKSFFSIKNAKGKISMKGLGNLAKNIGSVALGTIGVSSGFVNMIKKAVSGIKDLKAAKAGVTLSSVTKDVARVAYQESTIGKFAKGMTDVVQQTKQQIGTNIFPMMGSSFALRGLMVFLPLTSFATGFMIALKNKKSSKEALEAATKYFVNFMGWGNLKAEWKKTFGKQIHSVIELKEKSLGKEVIKELKSNSAVTYDEKRKVYIIKLEGAFEQKGLKFFKTLSSIADKEIRQEALLTAYTFYMLNYHKLSSDQIQQNVELSKELEKLKKSESGVGIAYLTRDVPVQDSNKHEKKAFIEIKTHDGKNLVISEDNPLFYILEAKIDVNQENPIPQSFELPPEQFKDVAESIEPILKYNEGVYEKLIDVGEDISTSGDKRKLLEIYESNNNHIPAEVEVKDEINLFKRGEKDWEDLSDKAQEAINFAVGYEFATMQGKLSSMEKNIASFETKETFYNILKNKVKNKEKIDSDDDGIISKKEIKEYLGDKYEKYKNDIEHYLDKDGNLDLESLQEDLLGDYKYYKQFDTNKDGIISKKELDKAAENYANDILEQYKDYQNKDGNIDLSKIEDNKLKKGLSTFDKDKDGIISKDEIKSYKYSSDIDYADYAFNKNDNKIQLDKIKTNYFKKLEKSIDSGKEVYERYKKEFNPLKNKFKEIADRNNVDFTEDPSANLIIRSLPYPSQSFKPSDFEIGKGADARGSYGLSGSGNDDSDKEHPTDNSKK